MGENLVLSTMDIKINLYDLRKQERLSFLQRQLIQYFKNVSRGFPFGGYGVPTLARTVLRGVWHARSVAFYESMTIYTRYFSLQIFLPWNFWYQDMISITKYNTWPTLQPEPSIPMQHLSTMWWLRNVLWNSESQVKRIKVQRDQGLYISHLAVYSLWCSCATSCYSGIPHPCRREAHKFREFL